MLATRSRPSGREKVMDTGDTSRDKRAVRVADVIARIAGVQHYLDARSDVMRQAR